MRLYEKYDWWCNLLSAIATRDGDRGIRHTVMLAAPTVIGFALAWCVFISPIKAPLDVTLWILIGCLIVWWYMLHHYASEVFDPNDFEHPTPVDHRRS